MGLLRTAALVVGIACVVAGCGGGSSAISPNDSTGGGIGGTGGGSGGTTVVATGTVTLKWTAPSTRVDNSAVSLSDIRSYRLYYGPSATNTPHYININNGSATEYKVTLPLGSYYFRLSAIDSNGYEGLISAASQKSI